jgi:hypothetical protein
MRGGVAVLGACALALAVAAPAAFGHAERPSYFPNFDSATKRFDPPPAVGPPGKVPAYRNRGTALVVCKPDSRRRIAALPRRTRAQRAVRNRNLRYLRHCAFNHIQAAVNAARSGTRILVLPGQYNEEPSRGEPDPDPKCAAMYDTTEEGGKAPSYAYHFNCPNSQNLIAIMGDSPGDPDRKCDRKCNLQISGTARPQDVLIHGERDKLNVIRADRADGIYLSNFTIEYSDFNNIYVLETDGFHLNKIVSRYSREYGFLSFASDHGLYENLEAFGSGDSGIYPGSGPEGHCARYGIEIRNSDSHHNTLGYSGTAGNGVWAHHNKFHHNATGIVTDSFAAGHPGMPQDCAKWEDNQVYSNNYDLFNDERDAYCKRPVQQRDPKVVCPTFQTAVGTGLMIAGGNGNITRGNHVYDNWRAGARLFWVPTTLRGGDSTGQSENDDTNQFDTSNRNSYVDNKMGVRPDGTRDPNGVDFWWDEEGAGNCWQGNAGPGGVKPTSDPASLPTCAAGGSSFSSGNPVKQTFQVPCATWDPMDNTDPPGCDWFDRPPEPR